MIVLLDGYPPACLLGSVEVDGEERAVYSGDALVAELQTDGMTREEALEWIDFNVSSLVLILWPATREELEVRAEND